MSIKTRRLSVTIALQELGNGKMAVSVRREERGSSHALQTFRNTDREAVAWALVVARDELLGSPLSTEDDAA